jgi:thiamine-phosphate diphosphorylase
MRPVICMITDRRRFGSGGEAHLVERAALAARAGVHLIQIREHDLEGGELSRLVAGCVDAVRGTRTRVLVNDRLDVALAAGARGVHLRGSSFSGQRARQMTPPGFLIGRSIHTPDDAAHLGGESGVDYLIFGTVFETLSKPGIAGVGTKRLAEAVAATPLPVLAVGGVSLGRLEAVVGAGAAGIAGIGLFADCRIEELPGVLEAVSRAFDSASAVS